MVGTTPLCAHCGRPIASGAMQTFGNAGEPYHFECTQPPRQQASFGCVCPPTSEQTCQASMCPRRGWGPGAVTVRSFQETT
jgi:hypothetical protein